IQREKADPAALAWRVLPRLLFPPQHPYAAPLTGNGSLDTLQGIDRARLRQHWHQLAPANSSLIATGAISMEELKQLAERHFANWQQAAPPAVVAPAAGMPARAIYLVDMPGAAQASVVSARRLPPQISEQRYAMALANDVFGGVFTSRLNMNLREDKHWAYGARSQLVETGDDWLWIASAQVQADKAGPALAEMRAELNGIAEGRPVNSDELAEVKAYRIRRQAGELETVDDWLAALAEQVRFKRPDDAIERYADEVRRTRLTAVQDVSSRWLKSRDMQWLVVGDLRVVKPQLEALGWLPVVVLE
ncbi:MAG TPA: insulinase family protein, partial [Spongiibacteraceae bacterium]|nr:insulinase family protein [Spongiibacteraceae bacterium]